MQNFAIFMKELRDWAFKSIANANGNAKIVKRVAWEAKYLRIKLLIPYVGCENRLAMVESKAS